MGEEGQTQFPEAPGLPVLQASCLTVLLHPSRRLVLLTTLWLLFFVLSCPPKGGFLCHFVLLLAVFSQAFLRCPDTFLLAVSDLDWPPQHSYDRERTVLSTKEDM